MSDTRALASIAVLITRPAHQAQTLATAVESDGGIAVRFPTIEILPAANNGSLHAALEQLNRWDIAIFVSANAAEHVLAVLHAQGKTWPPQVRTACVGNATAQALVAAGVPEPLVPTRHDSEGLLALPEFFDVDGKRIVIFRGNGGRELIHATLEARGADVTYIECYRRVRSTPSTAPLRDFIRREGLKVVVSTSSDGLRSLHEMAAEARPVLQQIPTVVLNEAQAAVGRTLGFTKLMVARDASDAAILEAIHAWHAERLPDNLPKKS